MKKLARTLLVSSLSTVIIILSSVSVSASPGGSYVEPKTFKLVSSALYSEQE